MKTVILLVALAFLVSLAVAHSDTEQNELLARNIRMANPGNQKGKIPRKKSSGQGKKGKKQRRRRPNRFRNIKKKKNTEGGKKNKKKAGKKQSPRPRPRKSKQNLCRQTKSVCPKQQDLLLKANAWKAQLRNYLNVVKNIQSKFEKVSGENGTVAKIFSNAASMIGKLTANGTKCSGGCEQSVCDSFKTLNNCGASVAEACPVPSMNGTNTTSCTTTIEDYFEICKNANKSKQCCAIKWDTKCLFKDSLAEAKKIRKSCLESFITCMSLVKNLASSLGNCLSSNPTVTTVSTNQTSVTTVAPATTVAPTTPARSNLSIFSENNVISRSRFMESGVVYEQVISFDPVNQEATFVVPGHLDRVSVTVVQGKDRTVTAFNEYCMVDYSQSEVDPETFSEKNDGPTDQDEIEADVREKEYFIYEYLGELTDSEKKELSATALEACKGKPIRKTKKEKVDQATWDKIKDGGSFPTEENSGRKKRQTQSCGHKHCMFRQRSAWCYTPIKHSLAITKVCVECCNGNNLPASSCRCALLDGAWNDQTTKNEWTKCYTKTQKGCVYGTYWCPIGSGECRDYTQQCSALPTPPENPGYPCFGGNVKCANICQGTNGAFGTSIFSKRECTEDGVEICVSNDKVCNGQCPSGRDRCGSGADAKCLTSREFQSHWTCQGKCLAKAGPPCKIGNIDQCAPGYFLCGGTCRKITTPPRFFECPDGTCKTSIQQCSNPDGRQKRQQSTTNVCITKDHTPCGKTHCLIDSHSWFNAARYRTCGDKCIYKNSMCDGKCPEGFVPCGKRCVLQTTFDKYYKDCDGKCYSKSLQCPNTCPSCSKDWFPCGKFRCVQDKWAKHYRSCGDKCQSALYPCEQICPAQEVASEVLNVQITNGLNIAMSGNVTSNAACNGGVLTKGYAAPANNGTAPVSFGSQPKTCSVQEVTAASADGKTSCSTTTSGTNYVITGKAGNCTIQLGLGL